MKYLKRYFEKMAFEVQKGNLYTFLKEHTIGLKLKK